MCVCVWVGVGVGGGGGYKQGVKVQNCKVISHGDFLSKQCGCIGNVLACQQTVDFTTLCKINTDNLAM